MIDNVFFQVEQPTYCIDSNMLSSKRFILRYVTISEVLVSKEEERGGGCNGNNFVCVHVFA